MTDLEKRVLEVQQRAYAPYSKFKVGAVVVMSGNVYEGVNIENASYPLSVCAERNAIAAGVTAGSLELEQVVVCTDASPPSSPCGGCRQVLREFARDPKALKIIAINPRGERREWTLEHLLPDSFSGSELP